MNFSVHIIEEIYPTLSGYKKQDAIVILEYVWKNSYQNIQVSDLLNRLEVDRLRVYPILFDFEKDHIINIITKDIWGSPISITLHPLFTKQYQHCISDKIKEIQTWLRDIYE